MLVKCIVRQYKIAWLLLLCAIQSRTKEFPICLQLYFLTYLTVTLQGSCWVGPHLVEFFFPFLFSKWKSAVQQHFYGILINFNKKKSSLDPKLKFWSLGQVRPNSNLSCSALTWHTKDLDSNSCQKGDFWLSSLAVYRPL